MLTFLLALAVSVIRLPAVLRVDVRAWRWWVALAATLLAATVAGLVAADDLVVRKLIGRLAMPLGLCWLVGVIISGIAVYRQRWPIAAISFTLTLLLTLAANLWLSGVLLRQLEQSIPTSAADAHFDAVLVCGGGTTLALDGEPHLGSSGDRLTIAADVWRDHRTPLLITSGSGIAGLDGERNLASETAHLWRRWGIPDEAIYQLPGPRTTSEEITAFATLMHERSWTNVAIISSGWHLPRIARLCQRAGITPGFIAADPVGRAPEWSVVDLVPSGGGAAFMHLACWETLGRWVGK